MNVIFVNWNEAPWFDPALRCAVAFAGCPVTVVSDRAENKAGAAWLDIREFGKHAELAKSSAFGRNPPVSVFEGLCFARWHVILALLQSGRLSLPVFCLDRDEMVFSDLARAARPFVDFDYACTYDGEVSRAPILINRLEPLAVFCALSLALIEHNAPALAGYNDMTAWLAFGKVCGWRIGVMSSVVDGGVFDNSLGCEQGCLFRENAKVLSWSGGRPYFAVDGSPVRAHTLHCWGGFKKHMAEYALKAGL